GPEQSEQDGLRGSQLRPLPEQQSTSGLFALVPSTSERGNDPGAQGLLHRAAEPASDAFGVTQVLSSVSEQHLFASGYANCGFSQTPNGRPESSVQRVAWYGAPAQQMLGCA
ncbi:MAG TPA: hypothetical protein VHE30_25400, partial [Polyangiaceae bacterium]|nr:hypothetical protein [Polyangiaceae bacterium]